VPASLADIAMEARSAAKEVVNVSEKYLEDFAVGQTYGSGRVTVDKDRIKAFAAEFDPQPFHLHDEAARDSIGTAMVRPFEWVDEHLPIVRRYGYLIVAVGEKPQ
jgi:hypothetical protein